MIDLSVLICSTHTRRATFGRSIQEQVFGQYEALSPEAQQSVEILMLTDNKKMMLGHKRNVMVDAAQGRYVVFVDDDDRLELDYLATLLDATVSDCDVITFLVSVRLNGGKPKECRYSIDFDRDRNTARHYERLPNHICAVKKEIAQQVSFPNIPYGEDAGYSKLLKPLLHTEFPINRVLYHYDYFTETTEAQEHKRAPLRVRRTKPIADVIILSKAMWPQDVEMTQRAVDTCIAGANSLPVRVFVVEQTPNVRYRGALMLHPPWQDFNYNRAVNAAAKVSDSKWIVVANNDLVFEDGWLHALLAADHPLVSPKNPRDGRQIDLTENTCGTQTGRHLSGWCFMVSRELWEQMGGFDERVRFWCSDDVVIEQAVALGVEPMLVPASKVHHIVSKTLTTMSSAEQDELTWGQIALFNELYGKRHRLSGHPKFLQWKKDHP